MPRFWILLVAVAAFLLMANLPVQAEEPGAVQVITGRVELTENIFFKLPLLKKGQTLYIYARGTSGDFDPFVAVLKPGVNIATMEQDYLTAEKPLVAAGQDPLVIIPKILKKFTLAWDDDDGIGYDATLTFKVPEDGDYHLLLRSTLARETFGDYRLLLGLDAPEVLTGKVQPRESTFAFLDKSAQKPRTWVQQTKDNITQKVFERLYYLKKFRAGDTVYVDVETTSGDLKPIVILRDFGEKPLSSANFRGRQDRATLQYTFTDDEIDCSLLVTGKRPDGTISTGEYRLLLRLNTPEVLTGQAVSTGQKIIRGPIPVRIGLKMQQVTHVDQRQENFGVVGSLMMRWQDPSLAFSPDTCQCRLKTFIGTEFFNYIREKGVHWPEFTLFNLQGNRWVQNRVGVVFPDGRLIYFERFAATMQAPDFNFRKFPFDQQKFFIKVDSIYPNSIFVFEELKGFSEVGKKLGEEEWIITDFKTEISTQTESTDLPSSRFAFRFDARRHLYYYIFRILMPLFIIIVVSWFSFFLKDYSKRVDVAGANLLIFIAFNFTIGGDLPRLGYLTFLDTLLVTTFIITGFVVIIAYWLRRMAIEGKEELVQRIDKYIRWFYPLAYIVGIAAATWLFG